MLCVLCWKWHNTNKSIVLVWWRSQNGIHSKFEIRKTCNEHLIIIKSTNPSIAPPTKKKKNPNKNNLELTHWRHRKNYISTQQSKIPRVFESCLSCCVRERTDEHTVSRLFEVFAFLVSAARGVTSHSSKWHSVSVARITMPSVKQESIDRSIWNYMLATAINRW